MDHLLSKKSGAFRSMREYLDIERKRNHLVTERSNLAFPQNFRFLDFACQRQKENRTGSTMVLVLRPSRRRTCHGPFWAKNALFLLRFRLSKLDLGCRI